VANDVEEWHGSPLSSSDRPMSQGNSAEFAPDLDDLLLPYDTRPPGTTLMLNTFPIGPTWGFQERTIADATFHASMHVCDVGSRLYSVGNTLLMPKLPALASISNKELIKKKNGRGPCKFRRKKARCMACVKLVDPIMMQELVLAVNQSVGMDAHDITRTETPKIREFCSYGLGGIVEQ
jgi:hypothetical protein